MICACKAAWTCGWTLAPAPARSGDPVAIAARLGGSDAFDTSITDFAQRYADQNERGYQAVLTSAKLVRSSPAGVDGFDDLVAFPGRGSSIMYVDG
jgi:hypothetical protein